MTDDTIRRTFAYGIVLCAALVALHGPWDDPGGPPGGCDPKGAVYGR